MPFFETVDLIIDDSMPIDDIDLAEYMHDDTIKSLTVRDVLNDKKIPRYIARRLFRGVLCSIEEKTTINFCPLNVLDKGPKNVNDWIIAELTRPRPNKILYLQNSLTDHLITKYVFIRKDHPYTMKATSKPIHYCLF